MELNSREQVKNSSLTLLDHLNKHLPSQWKNTFKKDFIDSCTEAPQSTPEKLIIKWNFDTKFYDISNIDQSYEEANSTTIPHLEDCLSELKQLSCIDPTDIPLRNIKMMLCFLFSFIGIFLIFWIINLGCYVNGVFVFGRTFWLIFIPLWQGLIIFGIFLTNRFWKRKAEYKWQKRCCELYTIIERHNVKEFAPRNMALKIGKNSSWLEFRKRKREETIKRSSFQTDRVSMIQFPQFQKHEQSSLEISRSSIQENNTVAIKSFLSTGNDKTFELPLDKMGSSTHSNLPDQNRRSMIDQPFHNQSKIFCCKKIGGDRNVIPTSDKFIKETKTPSKFELGSRKSQTSPKRNENVKISPDWDGALPNLNLTDFDEKVTKGKVLTQENYNSNQDEELGPSFDPSSTEDIGIYTNKNNLE